DQDGAAPGALARLDVVEDVADHPRALQVDRVLARRALQQAGTRLAAFAVERVAGHLTARMMGTAIQPGERCTAPGEHLDQPRAYVVEPRGLEMPERDAGLVADDEQRPPEAREALECTLGAAGETHPCRIDVVRH